MTMAEYCIARHFGQLLEASETRELTAKETERLEVLGRCVESYEGTEIQRAAAAAAGQRASGV